jgi:hypothetical protein
MSTGLETLIALFPLVPVSKIVLVFQRLRRCYSGHLMRLVLSSAGCFGPNFGPRFRARHEERPMFDPFDRTVDRTLRRLAKQRVRLVLQPGDYWVVDCAIPPRWRHSRGLADLLYDPPV